MLFDAVRENELFDWQPQTYRSCVWLEDEETEIHQFKSCVRSRIENESIDTQMERMSLLEVLRSRLYQRYVKDFRHALAFFLDPAIRAIRHGLPGEDRELLQRDHGREEGRGGQRRRAVALQPVPDRGTEEEAVDCDHRWLADRT